MNMHFKSFWSQSVLIYPVLPWSFCCRVWHHTDISLCPFKVHISLTGIYSFCKKSAAFTIALQNFSQICSFIFQRSDIIFLCFWKNAVEDINSETCCSAVQKTEFPQNIVGFFVLFWGGFCCCCRCFLNLLSSKDRITLQWVLACHGIDFYNTFSAFFKKYFNFWKEDFSGQMC